MNDYELQGIFMKYADDDFEIGWKELKEALNDRINEDKYRLGFNEQVCQDMAMQLGKNSSGKLEFTEFKSLCIRINKLKTIFGLYEKDDSGYLSIVDLKDALTCVGYTCSDQTLDLQGITNEVQITFSDFLMCTIQLEEAAPEPDHEDFQGNNFSFPKMMNLEMMKILADTLNGNNEKPKDKGSRPVKN